VRKKRRKRKKVGRGGLNTLFALFAQETSDLMSYLALAKKIYAELLRNPTDLTEGEIRAVNICSTVLQAHVWLAFDNDFTADDGEAVFYAHELDLLKGKTPDQLKTIYLTKLTFGGGRMRQ
jgi:hypothetical protein